MLYYIFYDNKGMPIKSTLILLFFLAFKKCLNKPAYCRKNYCHLVGYLSMLFYNKIFYYLNVPFKTPTYLKILLYFDVSRHTLLPVNRTITQRLLSTLFLYRHVLGPKLHIPTTIWFICQAKLTWDPAQTTKSALVDLFITLFWVNV